MSTMLIVFNGTRESGQFLGDTICSIKVAWEWVRTHKPDKVLLTLSPNCDLNFMWDKFIHANNAEIIYDTFEPGNMPQRFEVWNRWRKDREIEGRKFDIYRELYRRIDGSRRQTLLCGSEVGLKKRNIFEYFYFGQEEPVLPPLPSLNEFGNELIDHSVRPPEYHVLIAPYAKCQGNRTFTFEYWNRVIHRLIEAGLSITCNYHASFCEDLNGNPLFRKIHPGVPELFEEVCRHKIVACGNTGIGWVAGACGIPLLAMQPVDSNMQDYRYEWCGVKSLIEFLDQPDVDYCVKRIIEEVNRCLVLTTGCYDLLHAGHIYHLEKSRSMGTKLVVCLNSDASVRAMKGEGRPILPQEERATILRALRCVDEVRIFDEPTAIEIIQELRPKIITNGPDHKLEEIVGKDFVEQYGGCVYNTGATRGEASTTNIVKKINRGPDILKALRDAVPLTPNPFAKLKCLADEFSSVAYLEGDMADVGAYKGAASLVLNRADPDRDLHIFDTWTGNPYHDELCHHPKGDWACSLNECKTNVGEGLHLFYHEGVFPYSADGLETKNFAFVYIDVDSYQSTKEAIEWFWPRMMSGGKMMIDDYGWHACAGVKKAVDEIFSEKQLTIFSGIFTCVLKK